MVEILLKCLLQKMRKVNVILRKESRNMRLSIECKTLLVSVWDAVMKLTAVGNYYFNSDIRNFNNIKSPFPHFLYCIQFLRTSACVCRMTENCKSLVLQGECNIEIFLSPGYVTSASRYQSRSSMYIRGLLPRNWPRQFRLRTYPEKNK